MSNITVDELSKFLKDYIAAQAEKNAEYIAAMAERDAKQAERDAKQAERDAKAAELHEEYKKVNEEYKKDYEKRMKRLDQDLGRLGISYGDQVEAMFVNLGEKFNELGYHFPKEAEGRIKFRDETGQVLVEVDRFLENGTHMLSVEVKAKLKKDDVDGHIKRLGTLSEYHLKRNDRRKVIGAVAGGIVPKNLLEYAQSKGLYVLVQNGENIEVAGMPEDFHPREW